MKKNSAKGYAILGILLVLISVIAFCVPGEKTATFWIAYAFLAVAFAGQILLWRIALGEKALKSKFLGIPVVYVGAVYLVVQLIVSTVFLLIPTLPVWSAALACVLVTGVSGICMLAASVGQGEVQRTEEKVEKKVAYMRQLQVEVQLLAGREEDAAVKKMLMQLEEKIRFSDPMSHEQLAALEATISEKVAQLKTCVDKADEIQEIAALMDERNKNVKCSNNLEERK